MIKLGSVDYTSIEAMFVPKTDWAFNILEIQKQATNMEYNSVFLFYSTEMLNFDFVNP